MKPIFLIGFMCSGKTTLGQAVSRAAGVEFIDLDNYIEESCGMSVAAIFAEKGEAGFRRLELEALKAVAARDNVIVACGGGTPCIDGAMQLMNSRGTTVRLMPSAHRLVNRLMLGRKHRPLLTAIDNADDMAAFATEKQAQREPFYSKAAHTFDTTFLETDHEVALTSQLFIDRFIH